MSTFETQDNGAAPVATEAQETPAPNPPVVPDSSPPVAEAPKPDPMAPRFALLARKDKEQRERHKQLQHLEGIEKLAKDSPLQAMERLGLTYEQLTDAILSQGEPPKAEDKIAALEKRFAEKEAKEQTAREAAAAEQAERTVSGFKGLIKDRITAAGDTYELINALGTHDEVFELIELNHTKTGKLLTIEEAAQLVEDHLTEDTRKRLGLKKFAPAPATTAPEASHWDSRREKSGTRTLTNQVSSEVADGDDDLPLDPRERTRAIAQRFRLHG